MTTMAAGKFEEVSMIFDDYDTEISCEEIYEYGYFATHDGIWDEDSDCYIRREFYDEQI